MRHSIVAVSCAYWALMAVVLLDEKSDAFSFSKHAHQKQRKLAWSSLTILSATPADDPSAATTSPRRKPLSPQEILEQQRQKQGLEDDDDEYPKLFEDDLLDNMRQILLTLETRVKEGPGSLSMLEVEEFVIMSQDVAKEMKEKEYLRLQDAASGGATNAQTTATAASAAPVAETAPAPAPAPPVVDTTPELVQPVATTTAATAPPPTNEVSTSAVEDNEDGPGYDPSGGQGSLAKGTRNTYVIENMDEMSPEEYQKALQETISQQQEERRKKLMATGGYGNRASWDYLNNLTGQSGQLRSDSAFDD